MKEQKTYNGKLMKIGKANEDIIIDWIKTKAKDIIDFRDFRLAQRIDVDCGIETIDGKLVLAEIKADNWISETGNICFECFRINHYLKGKWFYLGWGWRSPAQKLIIRNPKTNETFVFEFEELRLKIGEYIDFIGKELTINITETDNQKTTFNFLVPMDVLKNVYRKFKIQ